MKFKQKLTYAALKGIQESFNIDDMRNDVTTMPSSKRAIEKHSKIYPMIKDICERYPMRNSRDFIALPDECKEVLCDLPTGDDETMNLLKEYASDIFVINRNLWHSAFHVISKILTPEPLDIDDKVFISMYM